jgi:hypothetical protein
MGYSIGGRQVLVQNKSRVVTRSGQENHIRLESSSQPQEDLGKISSRKLKHIVRRSGPVLEAAGVVLRRLKGTEARIETLSEKSF